MAVITSFSTMAGVGKRRPFSEQRGWAFAGGRPSRKSQEPVKLAPFGSALYLVFKDIAGSALEEEGWIPRILTFSAHRYPPPPDLPVTGPPS